MTSSTSPSPAPPAPTASSARPFGARIRGIDALRAIAVVLVMAYHLFPGTALGGFVGVDVFFVVSGFLITGLLVRERADSGRIRLGAFWGRRARRLLPALALVVGVCTSAALVLGGDVLVGIPRQLLGAVTFSYNWLDIVAGPGYFDASTPELLRNLWSLAVEEQFYLLWPLLVLALLLVRRPRVRAAIALALATASGIWMAVLSLADDDTTRAYYGTDSHSFGLALGAALAFVVAARSRPAGRALRVGLSFAGVLAIAGVVAIGLMLPSDDPLAQRGGLQLVAVLSAIAIAAVAVPQGILARALDVAPLRWVGARSYSLYLWHWPVYVLLVSALPAVSSQAAVPVIGIVATVIAVAAAWTSYRFVERPIRRDGLRATLTRWFAATRRSRSGIAVGAVASLAVIALVGGTGTAALVAPPLTSVEESIATGQQEADDTDAALPPAPPPAPLGELTGMPKGTQITAIGDSVMLAVTPWLKQAYPGIAVNAKVSRQLSSAPALVDDLSRDHRLRGILLVGLGTNGPIQVADLDRIRQTAGPNADIVLVNVQAPRDWTRGVNRTLEDYAATYRNVELADWNQAIHPHIDYLATDEIHAGGPKGAAIYLGAVDAAFQRLIDRPPLPRRDWLTAAPDPLR